MRIAAIGDAHLGRSYYPFTDPETGVNRRERDFELSFEAGVAAALDARPDLIVWLGDIFDHPRPTYRSYRIAQRQLTRIRDHGIPVVIISGNHDTPRLPGMGSPYSALADAFPEMHWAHRLQYERFELPDVVVHAVPQMLKVDYTLEALAEADAQRSLDKVNLLITHPRITQVEPRYQDINEIEVDQGVLKSDLVLLGHYHTFQRVADAMWYAGAPDNFNFADDPNVDKGVAILDSQTGVCERVPVPGRRALVTLDPVQAQGLGPRELQDRLLERASSVPEGAVVRLYVELADPESYRLVDMDVVRDAARAALILKIEPSFAAASNRVQLPQLEHMPAQWATYLSKQDLEDGYDRERIQRMGDEYIARALEEAGPAA